MNRNHIDDHEYFLGRLVASFQSLELVLVEYLAALVCWGDREVGYIVSDGLAFKKLVGVVDGLAKHRESPEQYATLVEPLKTCLKLEEERNRYVHGYWDLTPTQDGKVAWTRFKRKNKVGSGNVHQEELLTTDLDNFVQRSTELQTVIRKRIRKQ